MLKFFIYTLCFISIFALLARKRRKKPIIVPNWSKTVSALMNEDFLSLQSYCGYSLAMIDPDAPEYLFNLDVADEELGSAILSALENSRFIPYDEIESFKANIEGSYQDWISKLMNRYGCKTKRSLFKNMKSCGIYCEDGLIVIRPSHHEKLEAWSGTGIREEDYVKLPDNSEPSEIGAALRLAFSRCTG